MCVCGFANELSFAFNIRESGAGVPDRTGMHADEKPRFSLLWDVETSSLSR